MSSGKVLVGVLAGLAAGALAGILFSPAKGSKTRKRIIKKGATYSDVLKEKFNELLELVVVKFEEVMDEVSFADKKQGQPEDEVLQDSQII